MSTQIGAINTLNEFIAKIFKQPKGDLADRLNTRLTVAILSLAAVLLLSGQFFGDAITCWLPHQFTKDWIAFVNQYCFVHGTYFVPLDQELSHDENERRKQPITYYQWVPYILAGQAFLFYMPRFIWKSLCARSGYDLAGSIRYVDDFWTVVKAADGSFRDRLSHFEGRPAVYVWDALRLARKKGSHLIPLYYAIGAALQAANAWIQFYLINMVISTENTFWGPSVLMDIVSGNDWQSTGHFPRITHCDFNRRRPASVQLDTVLCVLSMNIYYEKIFLFLWFWILFVSVVSTINAFYWIYICAAPYRAQSTINSYLETDPQLKSRDSIVDFYNRLGSDGLFVLHQMAVNLGDLPTSYLAISMRAISNRYEEEDKERGKMKWEKTHLIQTKA
ncbi:unnamed protein product, partial [Mesorhabditis belari]|uniref:Innexin n=1 Tax=Mesorhabditis belari TaxID=2138241 RepID=A0AAF3FS06_9BILA